MPRVPACVLAVAAWVFAAAGSASAATTYYVRPDGSDASCNGSANAGSGSAPNCAWASIGKAIASSACGDTVRVQAGTYRDRAQVLGKACSAASPWRLIGEGSSQVTWHTGAAARLSGCSLEPGTSAVYRCAIPSGALTALPDNGGYIGYACMSQKLSAELPIVAAADTKKDVTGFMCLTPHSSTGTVTSTPGSWAISGSNYLVHLWNDANPSTEDVFPPTESARADAGSSCLNVTGNFQTVQGMTIADGCGHSMYMSGDDDTFSDVTIYNGGIYIDDPAARFTLQDFTVALSLRRPFDTTTPSTDWTSWERNNQTAVIQGTDFTINNADFYGGREGLSFSAGGPGKVDRMKVHFNYNHNMKLLDSARDITFNNLWLYNSGGGGSSEVLFIEGCVRNISFRNSTFTEAINIHAAQNGCADGIDGPANLDVYNSLINEVYWLSTFGDPRSGARGHDFNYNTYVNNFRSPGNQVIHHHSPSSTPMRSLPSWQNWSADPCTNCTRDPNSVENTKEKEYTTWGFKDERTPLPYDFHLKTGAASIDRGSSGFSPPRDLDNITRDASPDIGAYEKTSGTPDTTPPAPVTNFTGDPGDQQVTLRWNHSATGDATGTRIRYRTGSYPTGPADGTLACEKSGSPGAADSCVHTGLTNGTTYYYTAYAYDAAGNFATGVNMTATPVAPPNPPPGSVSNNHRTDVR